MNFPYDENIVEIDVLKSQFIGILTPILKEKDIDITLNDIKKRFPKADHYPFASRLLPFEKCSDDGEPPRSAGLPLLELLRAKKFDKCLLVIVRYFGGIKLGLGRLARTFREVASSCLDSATLASFEEGIKLHLSSSYSVYSMLEEEAKKCQIEIQAIDFSERVSLSLSGNAKIINSLVSHYEEEIKVNKREPILIKRRINND